MISLVVPLKGLSSAKSRFVGVDPVLRRRLAWSMFCDTVLVCAEIADRVVVVSDVPGVAAGLHRLGVLATVVPDPGGLNSAFTAGAAATPMASLVGGVMSDLPALTQQDLTMITTMAAEHPRAFVADADEVGTTMLFSTDGPLDPQFDDGQAPNGSAARHRSGGAVPLPTQGNHPSWPGARRDVDDSESLAAAARIGLGRHTRSLTGHDGRLGMLTQLTVAEHSHDGELIMVTGDGRRITATASAADGLRLRPGQQCSAAVDSDHCQVLSVWI